MKAMLQRLTQQCHQEQQNLERLDPFAPAMLMGPEELNIAEGTPIAECTDEGWIAALWLRETNDSTVGQKLIVARGCRTRKIALITANYFRLHHLINQEGNKTDTSHSF